MIKEKLDFDQAVKIIEQDIIKVNAGKIINNKNYIVESVFYEEVEEENNPSLDMCFQVFMKDKSKTDKRYKRKFKKAAGQSGSLYSQR